MVIGQSSAKDICKRATVGQSWFCVHGVIFVTMQREHHDDDELFGLSATPTGGSMYYRNVHVRYCCVVVFTMTFLLRGTL